MKARCALLRSSRFACALALSPAAFAWEADVHYGLTKVLAINAGYNDLAAEQIAAADQGIDDSPSTDAVSLISQHVVCNKDIAEATKYSKEVQRLHFPSADVVPARPDQRKVSPDPEGLAAEIAKAGDLARLGELLHAYQDSWSHRGMPDVPFNSMFQVQPERIWAHPADRGGWYSHDADLTSTVENKAAVREMAQASYQRLQDFLRRPSNHHYGKPSNRPWSKVETKISFEKFVGSSTKLEKLKWLSGNGLDFDRTADVLQSGSNLPNGKGWGFRKLPERSGFESVKTFADRAPAELRDSLYRFLAQWLVEGSIESAAESFDVPAIEEQLGPTSKVKPSVWIPKFLTMWIVRDHGEINAMGHGARRASAYDKLPATRDQAEKMGMKTVTGSGVRVRGHIEYLKNCQKSLADVKNDKLLDGGILTIISIEPIPRDFLGLVWARQNGRWAIVRVFWLTL